MTETLICHEYFEDIRFETYDILYDHLLYDFRHYYSDRLKW